MSRGSLGVNGSTRRSRTDHERETVRGPRRSCEVFFDTSKGERIRKENGERVEEKKRKI